MINKMKGTEYSLLVIISYIQVKKEIGKEGPIREKIKNMT